MHYIMDQVKIQVSQSRDNYDLTGNYDLIAGLSVS